MRVSVVRGGGLAGLVRTTTVDADRLSAGDRRELAALVQQAGISGPAAARSYDAPEPDRFSYLVTVEDQGRRRQAGFTEQSLPEGVRNLISWITTADGREDSIEPPGGGSG